MSIVVKTLTCGSLSNGNSSNGNNIKSTRIRQNTGGVMSSKKVKVSTQHSFYGRITICDVCLNIYNRNFALKKASNMKNFIF
jgi:hypothetical protein